MTEVEMLKARILELEAEVRRLKGEVNPKDVMKMFMDKFQEVRTIVPYNENWLHPNRLHFELALDGKHAVQLKPGEMAKSQHPDSGMCKMIFIGTRWGPVVVWGRELRDDAILYCTMLSKGLIVNLRAICGRETDARKETGMSLLLGVNEENIGFLIEKLMVGK